MTNADQKRAAMLSQMYPQSEGAIRVFHTFMLASADIECRDAIEQSEFIEGVEYFLAMFRKRRGGDPLAQQRRQRDEDLRALHRLTGANRPIEKWAEEEASILSRFRPLPNETSPERRLRARIKANEAAGLKPISPGRIRKIVVKQ